MSDQRFIPRMSCIGVANFYFVDHADPPTGLTWPTRLSWPTRTPRVYQDNTCKSFKCGNMIGLSAVRAHLTSAWHSKLENTIFPGDAEAKEDCQTVRLSATLGWNGEQILENFNKAWWCGPHRFQLNDNDDFLWRNERDLRSLDICMRRREAELRYVIVYL